MEKISSIKDAAASLLSGRVNDAARVLKENCPHKVITVAARRYTVCEKMRLFCRDGFIDRYSGDKLVNPGILKILSYYCPKEFPYHPHWKTSETHIAYWELTPTIDHVIPVALGGIDDASNWVTTSMLHNQIKSVWTLEQLNWSLRERGDIREWDGLTQTFMKLVANDKNLLNDAYIKRWFEASAQYFELLA